MNFEAHSVPIYLAFDYCLWQAVEFEISVELFHSSVHFVTGLQSLRQNDHRFGKSILGTEDLEMRTHLNKEQVGKTSERGNVTLTLSNSL